MGYPNTLYFVLYCLLSRDGYIMPFARIYNSCNDFCVVVLKSLPLDYLIESDFISLSLLINTIYTQLIHTLTIPKHRYATRIESRYSGVTTRAGKLLRYLFVSFGRSLLQYLCLYVFGIV